MIRPDWGEQLRLERGEDEEIVFNEPLLANPSEGQEDPMPLLPNILEEVTDVEHAMFAPAAAVLGKEEEEIQANIGLSLVQELDQEIPDTDAVRIENEGEVQQFTVPEPTAGESPAEELIATSVVRQPPFFQIPQSSDDGEAEEEEEQIIFQTAEPKTKAMPKAPSSTVTGDAAPLSTLHCLFREGRLSLQGSQQRQAKAWVDRSMRLLPSKNLPLKDTAGSWVVIFLPSTATSGGSTHQRWRRLIAR